MVGGAAAATSRSMITTAGAGQGIVTLTPSELIGAPKPE